MHWRSRQPWPCHDWGQQSQWSLGQSTLVPGHTRRRRPKSLGAFWNTPHWARFAEVSSRVGYATWKLEVCGGANAPLLSSATGTIGGKATGVGILANCPIRPLSHKWPQQDWSTGRLQAAAVHVQHNWFKVGTFYGFAKDAHTKATKDRSDCLPAFDWYRRQRLSGV